MIVSISDQATTFFLTVVTGIVLGVFYDVIRILRRIIRHNKAVTNIEDLLYWILGSIFFFYVLYNNNYGEIRGFAILGTIIGVTIYYLLFSHYFIKIIVSIINTINKIIHIVIKIIFYPIIMIIKIVTRPFRFVLGVIGSFIKNKLTAINKWYKIKLKKILKDLRIMTHKV